MFRDTHLRAHPLREESYWAHSLSACACERECPERPPVSCLQMDGMCKAEADNIQPRVRPLGQAWVGELWQLKHTALIGACYVG